uniref:Uncharacterized protein n=1 Tax=Triticum urartu TaxID=4572 RepID=A0A8R7QIQ7_TRIUA
MELLVDFSVLCPSLCVELVQVSLQLGIHGGGGGEKMGKKFGRIWKGGERALIPDVRFQLANHSITENHA